MLDNFTRNLKLRTNFLPTDNFNKIKYPLSHDKSQHYDNTGISRTAFIYMHNWETEATLVFSRGGQRTIHRSEFVCTQVGGGPRVIRQLRSFRFKHGPARFAH